jgi:hypothetical protein
MWVFSMPARYKIRYWWGLMRASVSPACREQFVEVGSCFCLDLSRGGI